MPNADYADVKMGIIKQRYFMSRFMRVSNIVLNLTKT
jgi:hypothetical protein